MGRAMRLLVAVAVAAAVLGCSTTMMHTQSNDKVMIKSNPSGTHIKVMDKQHGK